MTVSEAWNTDSSQRGHPWLAAGLSWLLPGAGHLYCRAYIRAIGFLLLFFLFEATRAALLFSSYLPDGLAVVLGALIPTLCRAGASADAFRLARRLSFIDSESMRGPTWRAYFAVFLTTIIPGLGQFYQRRWRSGVGFLSLYVWLGAVVATHLAGMAGIIIVQVVASVHAFLARTCEMDDRTRRAAWLLAGLIGATLAGSWVLWSIRRSFFIEGLLWNGYSMVPTVPYASHCIEDKVTYRYRDPEIGDIVVLTPPEIPGAKGQGMVTQLSRIVAREGEAVHVRGGAIFVNGEYREPARTRIDSGSTVSPSEEASYYGYIYAVARSYRVPEGHYFVIGDNRISGVDSRSYGPISKKDVIGRITRVYWRPWRRHLPPPPRMDRGELPNREGGGNGTQISEEQMRDLLDSSSKGKKGKGQVRPSN